MFPFEGASRGLGGLKLDGIDAANSFLMLPMARNSLNWQFKTHFRPVKNQIFKGRPSASGRPQGSKNPKFWGCPGCFGGCPGVVFEHFYGMFEEHKKMKIQKFKNWFLIMF